MPTSTRNRPALDRDRIVECAIALADADGLEALSMRKVATELGCGVMSLYNHVADKEELIGAMVDAIAAEVPPPQDDTPPLRAIRRLMIDTRAVFVAHPWAPAQWNVHFPGPQRTAAMDVLLRLFSESGLSPDLAHHGYHAVTNHVLGYTLQTMTMRFDDEVMARVHTYVEEIADEHPHAAAHVHEHLDGQTAPSFELVLDLILDGLVRLDQDRG